MSASLVEQELLPDVSLMERVARLEQVVEKMVGKFLPHALAGRSTGARAFLVPQIKEEVSERTQHAHFGREPFDNDGHQDFDCDDPKDSHQPLTSVDQPGDQVRRDPQACCVATAGQLQTVAKTLEAPPVPFIGRTVDVHRLWRRRWKSRPCRSSTESCKHLGSCRSTR